MDQATSDAAPDDLNARCATLLGWRCVPETPQGLPVWIAPDGKPFAKAPDYRSDLALIWGALFGKYRIAIYTSQERAVGFVRVRLEDGDRFGAAVGRDLAEVMCRALVQLEGMVGTPLV